jgi:hypothetical protein
MLDIIHQQLQAIENMQSDLEKRIREALGALGPEEILNRADDLPYEIAEELRAWIESNVIPMVEVAAKKFLLDLEEEDTEVDEQSVHGALIALLDHYVTTVTILTTAAVSEIVNQAEMQGMLGRNSDLIIDDLSKKTSGIGARWAAYEKSLISATDVFLMSAARVALVVAKSGERLTWITVLDRRVCVDCGPRHGTTLAAEDWAEQGLPGTGWSVCLGNCRCILVPEAAFAKSNPGPVIRPRRSS